VTDLDRALDAAPSELRGEEPTIARLLAVGGLGLTALGVIAVIANQYGPRFVSATNGILCAFLGLVLLLHHAFRDGDIEFRMVYTGVGFAALIGAVVVTVLPGRPGGEGTPWQWGHYLMPYAPLVFLLALLFLTAAGRHETSAKIVAIVNGSFLAVAAALSVAPLVIGLAQPNLLAGPGLLLAVVGSVYACAYLGRVGTADGLGRFVGIALGLIGALALYYAVARSAFPSILHDGPRAVQTAARNYDWSLVGIRLAFAAVAAFGAFWCVVRSAWPGYAKAIAALAFGSIAAVLLLGIFAAPLAKPLEPYLVPGGLILGFLGLLYLAVSLAFCCDAPFVAMVVRELGSFFVSPIAYLVLIGVSLMAGIGYLIFLNQIIVDSPLAEPAYEPIVGQYWFAATGVAFLCCFIVPSITMRLFSEERRSGTLDLLVTAPVGEWSIVSSKFLAAWLFHLLIWVPTGLFLVGLPAANGPFDSRPLLSYYVAHAASGAGFIALGLFFSSLTRNQIVAAVLTGASLLALLFTVVLRQLKFGEWFAPVSSVLTKFDYLTAWNSALNGQLPLSFIVVYLSFAAFWLYLTVKVLEARRWA
jgi:ABC-type transport system involved in multi-copper enzyme maturation permease subunit